MVQADLEQWIASGNVRRAASSLVVDYESDVFATCMAMVKNRSAAEDLTQDIFSEAIRGLSSYRGESAPRTWLLSIARHRCIDYLRARKRDPWGGSLTDEEGPDAHPDQAANGHDWFANRDQVSLALDSLTEGDRALVVLRFKNGLEYEELAEAFGLRTGTVRMRVSRALARMRETLEPSVERARAPAAAPAMGAPAPMAAMAPPAAPGGIARGAAPAAPPPPSWWQRLVAWARAPQAPRRASIGDFGRSIAFRDEPSEALHARLGSLIEKLPE